MAGRPNDLAGLHSSSAMSRIALVQNRSEMAYYGYADASRLLAQMGHDVQLFTAENIEELAPALALGDLDAVVFGSNALNDDVVLDAVRGDEARTAIEGFLGSGRGLLCMHQRHLASDGAHLDFLPDPLNRIQAVSRPESEKVLSGRLAIAPAGGKHVAILYPNTVAADGLAEAAGGFASLPGLYWHCWDGASLEDWDVLLDDPDKHRMLVLASRRPGTGRVVLSSLLLDWQGHRDFLQNLVLYVADGPHATAILAGDRDDPGLRFLDSVLRARRFPFRRYVLPEVEQLERHMRTGVHSTLVLGTEASTAIDEDLSSLIADRVGGGSLRLVRIQPRQDGERTRTFSVASGSRYALRLLQLAEVGIRAGLQEGYLEGSFLKTVDTLKALEVQGSGDTYAKLAPRVLQEADRFDREGSMDETFGATCALYWLRRTYRGADDDSTRRTSEWLRRELPRHAPWERALALVTFASFGEAAPDDEEDLRKLVDGVVADPSGLRGLTDRELLLYAEAAVAAGSEEAVTALAGTLVRRADEDGWRDLSTAAEVTLALMDAADAFPELLRDSSVRRVTVEAVSMIQDRLLRAPTFPPRGVPRNTLVRCLRAWLRFDETLDLPVYELVDTLEGFGRAAAEEASTRTSLSVLDSLRSRNDELETDLRRASGEAAAADSLRTTRTVLAALLGVVGYLFVSVVASLVARPDAGGFAAVMKTAFVDAWAVHVGLASAAGTLLAVPGSRNLLRRLVRWRSGGG